MLTEKEINKIAESTYPRTLNGRGEMVLDAKPVFNQAKAYVSLVEKIKGLELRSGFYESDHGWNRLLLKLKSFTDES